MVKRIRAKGKKAKPTRVEGETPTKEQIEDFQRIPVKTERGQVTGYAYRRKDVEDQAAFNLTDDEITAIKHYRSNFERCDFSPIKDSCNFSVGGGSGEPSIALLNAKRERDDIERAVKCTRGASIEALHLIGIKGMTLNAATIELHGSRSVKYIENGVHRERIKPVSHAAIDQVRSGFLCAVDAIVGYLVPVKKRA